MKKMPTTPKRSKSEVQRLIEEAFRSVLYPGDDRIVVDDGGLDPEREVLREVFRGKHWSEVPHEVVRWHYDGLPHLTEEGRRFFLPAFMLAGMEPDDIAGFAVLHLTDPADFEEFRRYTPEQRAAVKAFLEFQGDPRFVERAIREVWSAD